QGARVEDPATVLRARLRRAQDAGGDRRADGDHARARAADQGEGAESFAARVAGAGAGELSRMKPDPARDFASAERNQELGLVTPTLATILRLVWRVARLRCPR